MAGHSSVNSLVGSTFWIPYIAVTSISSSSGIFDWAKGLS